MVNIKISDFAGSFAENKDVAQSLRQDKIIPILEKGENIQLDFQGVDAATQSFVHALISDLLRIYGDIVLDKIEFKDCNDTVKKIIEIVVSYMQES